MTHDMTDPVLAVELVKTLSPLISDPHYSNEYVGITARARWHILEALGPPPIPGMRLIEVDGHQCNRCRHQWVPLNKKRQPGVCPKCKSPYWNSERKFNKERNA